MYNKGVKGIGERINRNKEMTVQDIIKANREGHYKAKRDLAKEDMKTYLAEERRLVTKLKEDLHQAVMYEYGYTGEQATMLLEEVSHISLLDNFIYEVKKEADFYRDMRKKEVS